MTSTHIAQTRTPRTGEIPRGRPIFPGSDLDWTGGTQRSLDVAVVDDIPLILHGLRGMLEPYAHRVREVIAAPGAPAPGAVDITLYDPARQAPTSWSTLDRLLSDPAHGQVVVYSFDPQLALLTQMLTRGCAGFVDKRAPAAELVDAITSMAAAPRTTADHTPGATEPKWRSIWPGKEHGLSLRESELVCLITDGLTNEDISHRAGLSSNTVKTYIRSAYRKLGITRRSEAVRWGVQHGMADQHPRTVHPRLSSHAVTGNNPSRRE